jgi:xanthine dehydrogenase accessory factor
MQMKDLFAAILAKTQDGEDTVLATIEAEVGTSPLIAGAHMLEDTGGLVCGTIGGGTVEYKSIEYAQKLLEQRQSRRKTYRLHRNDEEDIGMECGGDVDVYFQCIKGGDEVTIALMEDGLARLEQDGDLWLFIDLTSPSAWTMALYSVDRPLVGMELAAGDIPALAPNNGVMVRLGERRIYSEPVNFAGKVFIFGAGHVAQALQPVLASVGFRCVVYDNREEFVSRDLFPSAYDLMVGDYDNLDVTLGIGERDYVVIVTHAYDLAVLRQIIAKNCAYIGVIGSKTKVSMIKQQLTREGVSEAALNTINAPIGLRIRSETPEEIAVSITGEMILRRAEKRAEALGKR